MRKASCRLPSQAQAIGEIITVVNDLAEQTNILALNASIEATRAGEQGKGFSVVAAEIKALADQSKKATVQVRQILSEIQKSTNAAVMATEQGTKSVDEAMRIVNEADEAIRMLVDTIVEAAQASTSISTSVGQQAVGMSQIQQRCATSIKRLRKILHRRNNPNRLREISTGSACACARSCAAQTESARMTTVSERLLTTFLGELQERLRRVRARSLGARERHER